MIGLIARLDDEAATDAARFGAKAANQARLGRAGLPIQHGFCLDAGAYRLQLRALGLEQAAVEASRLEGTAARPYVSAVRIGLFEGPITPAVREPLRQIWHELAANGSAGIVVRSSALLEDSGGSTFAGQFETFLGLDNEDDFLTAVRACWAALWSSRALQYMSGHALRPAGTAMALCIQPQVQALASGGGMSRTADGNMLLSATRGLGTSIAQGTVVPDRYLLRRDGVLLEAAGGYRRHEAGCPLHGVPRSTGAAAIDAAGSACLDERRATELGRLMLQAERLLGLPIEIEWALDASGFRILQARPLCLAAATVPNALWSRHPGLRGQPSGVGWASGRSCVINCECELSRVAPGDVLVTRVAGPALGQVLPRIAGVVAELGGSTSHLASLARERGIPAVLGVAEATRKIPDGVQLGVDGVAGIVRWQH